MLTIVVLPHLKDKRFADETLLLQGIFEVMRSDGTCQPITEDTVRELKELVPTFFFFLRVNRLQIHCVCATHLSQVRVKKAQLDAAERKYSSNCCVSSEELMGASGNLLHAHDEYRKVPSGVFEAGVWTLVDAQIVVLASTHLQK